MNDRRPRNSWLIGLTAGILLALLVAPSTGWIVRTQLPAWGAPTIDIDQRYKDMGIKEHGPLPPGLSSVSELRDLRLLVRLRPNDYDAWLALATELPDYDDSVTVLEEMLPRFGGRPSLHAHLLCAFSSRTLGATRYEGHLLITGYDNRRSGTTVDFGAVHDVERQAAEGEKLDPANAYFPFMRACALFSLHRDQEAREAVIRAGGKPGWDDYLWDAAQAVHRSIIRLYGGEPVLDGIMRESSISTGSLALAMSGANQVVFEAVQAEKAGHIEQGLALRHALMRYGGLQRHYSRQLGLSLVGSRLARTAMAYPGGRGAVMKERLDGYVEPSLPSYRAYLNSIHHPEEARFAANEVAAEDKAKSVLDTSLDYCSCLLDAPRHGRPSMYFGMFQEDAARIVWAWLVDTALLSTAIFLALWMGFGRVRRARPGHRGRAFLAWAVAFLAVAWLWYIRTSHLVGVLGYIDAALPWDWGDPPGPVAASLARFFLLPLAGPLLVPIAGFLCFLVRLVRVLRRRANRPGKLGRWFAPAVTILLILYAGAVVVTAGLEEAAWAFRHAAAVHEGRFEAAQAGIEWPGPPP